ncbi:LysM domain/BON superfamily protein [compost metagenome]
MVKEEAEALSDISKRVYGTPDYHEKIKELNNLSDADAKNLFPGQILQLPNEFLLKGAEGATA